jgi:hypothetical protein
MMETQLKLPLVRDFLLAPVLFHEIGRHMQALSSRALEKSGIQYVRFLRRATARGSYRETVFREQRIFFRAR